MFRENTSHLQGRLFSILDELPEAARKILEKSWAAPFYEEVFCRIDEQEFAVLYSGNASRPNVPVNVLVCLEILKHGNGWTDEEMYQNYLLDLKVRLALGYVDLKDGYFAIRTIYNFRDALSKHMQETGENLFERAFEQITDEQVEAFGLQTDKQRTDSTQLMSNIRKYSRISLLVEVLRRVNRMLSKADKQNYASLLAPYTKEVTEHYVHGLKNSEYSRHLGTIGKVMNQLVSELAATYGDDEIYSILQRSFTDHFRIENNEVALIPGTEVKADSLQSPDDLDATYRKKRGESYRGYVANVTETCNPENEFQLITKTQTESNVTDDAAMLIDAIPNLAERTDIDTCYSDGGYNSPELDPVLDEHDVTHIQTAIRGGTPDADKVTVNDFSFEFNEDGLPIQATCPQGQVIPLEPSQSDDRFIGRPDKDTCGACQLFSICAARPQGKQRTPALYLAKRQILLACKRQILNSLPQSERNLRPPVESTIHSLKNPFRHGKILLRGKFRVSCAVIGSAFMANLRRIHRHQQCKSCTPTPSLPIVLVLAYIILLMSLFSRFLTHNSLYDLPHASGLPLSIRNRFLSLFRFPNSTIGYQPHFASSFR